MLVATTYTNRVLELNLQHMVAFYALNTQICVSVIVDCSSFTISHILNIFKPHFVEIEGYYMEVIFY